MLFALCLFHGPALLHNGSIPSPSTLGSLAWQHGPCPPAGGFVRADDGVPTDRATWSFLYSYAFYCRAFIKLPIWFKIQNDILISVYRIAHFSFYLRLH